MILRFANTPLRFHETYDTGWIFFTNIGGVVSDGIGWFERWQRRQGGKGFPIVTHTGVVRGENEIVESHWDNGVQVAPLDKYPAREIIFRKPRGWTRKIGIDIAVAAVLQVGAKYNRGLILAEMLANCWLGHWVNILLRGRPNKWVSDRLSRKREFICSQLSAYALSKQMQYKGLGVLAQPLDTISPQMLFEDRLIWDA